MNISSPINPSFSGSCTPAALPYIPIQDLSAAMVSCWKEAGKAVQMISACPFSKSFWEQVHREGEFSIQCLPAEELKHPAMVEMYGRKIMVSTFKLPEELGMMHKSFSYNILFELSNLKQYRRVLPLLTDKCSISPVDYGESIESIEYVGKKNIENIFKKCVEQQFWAPEELISLDEMSLSEEENFDLQVFAGHTLAYFLDWYRECSPKNVKDLKLSFFEFQEQGAIQSLPYNFYADYEPNTLEEILSYSWFQETRDSIARFARSFFG